MVARDKRDAAISELLGLLDSLRGAATVSVHSAHTTATFRIPSPAPPPEPRADDEPDCRVDILAVLTEAGRRLTTTQILAELDRRGCVHGERTVRGHLAAMVADGSLTNDRRARPPGYAPALQR